MRTVQIIVTALAAAILAGCGAATRSEPPADSVTPAASAAQPRGKTPMSRAEAGKYYLASVKQYNVILQQCSVIDEKGELYEPEVQRALAACRKLPGAIQATTHALQHPPAPWPAEARESIQDLVDSNQAFYYCTKQLRHAKTVDDYWRGPACPDNSDDRSADIVRAHLGLPPVNPSP
jgi:hypothetical protein